MNSHSNKRQYWKAQIDHFKVSGLSVRAFCAKEGLNQHTFGYWREQLGERQKRKASLLSNFLPVVVSSPANENRNAKMPDPKWVAEFLKSFLNGVE